MLYLAKCRECAFLTGNSDSLAFKQDMANHLSDSHSVSYDFVSKLRISDFSDAYIISRFKGDSEQGIILAMHTKGFWKAQRKSLKSPIISGLARGSHSLN